MAICLVTGGAGFVGSHLVDVLLDQGHRVRVLDDFSTGMRSNLPAAHPQLEIIRSDLNDAAVVAGATKGADYVFHLAIPSQASYEAEIGLNRWACTTDTLNVLAAAHKAGVKRLIYSSCECVYGPMVTRPLVETDPTLPLTPYAFAKLTSEQQCVAFAAMFGLETVRLRYFNVFGPRQASSGAQTATIFQILRSMLLDQNPTLESDGCEPHDFIYVDDVVHANLLAIEAPRVSGRVYNIARGRPTTLNHVVATVNAILGTNLQPQYVPRRSTGRGSRLTDIGRAEAELGFCPGTDLEQGLRRCIAYYRAHPEEIRTAPNTPSRGFAAAHFALGGPEVLDGCDSDNESCAASVTTVASGAPVPATSLREGPTKAGADTHGPCERAR